MDYVVVYSEAAFSDLHEIAAFISSDSREIAKRFGNRLVDRAEALRRMPLRGRPVKGWPDLRVVILSPYLIFYRLSQTMRRVEILRFWHGARGSDALSGDK